jgi:hypothetical protein
VVRIVNSPARREAAEMSNEEAGRRFKEVVDVAIARSPNVHSVSDLLRCTKLHPNTLYDIFNGDLEDGPGPRTVNRIATCLNIPTRWLWDAWQGKEPEPDSAEEALRRHADAVDRQNRLLGDLVGFIRLAAEAVVAPLEDTAEEAEAQDRAEKVVRLRRALPESEGSSKPPAPRGTKE